MSTTKVMLGSAMKSSSLAQSLASSLSEQVFSGSVEKEVYRLIVRLGCGESEAQLSTYMANASGPGVAKYLSECYTFFDPINFSDYLSSQTQEYLTRVASEKIHGLVKNIEERPDEAYRLATSISEDIASASGGLHTIRFQSDTEVAEKLLHRIEAFRESGQKYVGVPTMWSQFEQLQNSFVPGLSIILSRPSHGKTQLMLDLMLQMKQQGIDCGMISMEMSLPEIQARMSRTLVGASMMDFLLGKMTDEQMAVLRERKSSVGSGKVHMVGTEQRIFYEDFPEIVRRMRRAGAKIIFGDYIQLIQMRDRNKTSNRYQELSLISDMLQRASKENQVPIVMCAQATREVEKRSWQQPRQGDIADCSGIEQNAGLILSAMRPHMYGHNTDEHGAEYGASYTIVQIVKKREFEEGVMGFRFNSSTGRYLEMPNGPLGIPIGPGSSFRGDDIFNSIDPF